MTAFSLRWQELSTLLPRAGHTGESGATRRVCAGTVAVLLPTAIREELCAYHRGSRNCSSSVLQIHALARARGMKQVYGVSIGAELETKQVVAHSEPFALNRNA